MFVFSVTGSGRVKGQRHPGRIRTYRSSLETCSCVKITYQFFCYESPGMCSRVHVVVRRPKIAVSVSKSVVLVSHTWSSSYCWSWSVADLGMVHPIFLFLNVKFHHRKLTHMTITRYSKLTG